MINIGNTGRLIIALVLTFGVLAYIVQGEKEAVKTTGMDLPSERPVQEGGKYDTSAAGEVRERMTAQETGVPKAEDIFKGAASKSEGGTSFFIEYRLERDRQRSQRISLLKQIIDNPNSSGEGRQEAQKRLVELTQQMDLEMQLEKLIVAKGYEDAAIFIQPSAVNVVVMADKFNEEDAGRIGDLISRSTGRPLEQISIIVKKH